MLPALFLLVVRSPLPQSNQTIRVAVVQGVKVPFVELARAFEAQAPGTKVVLMFGASTKLTDQLTRGAPFDVLAANSLEVLETAPLQIDSVKVFASNKLALAVRKDYKGFVDIRGLNKVPRLSFPTPTSYAYRYTNMILNTCSRDLGKPWVEEIKKHVVSEEPDLATVYQKVLAGQVDAGMVYESDTVLGTGKVQAFRIPDSVNLNLKFPIGLSSRPTNEVGGRAFIKFVMSPSGQQILAKNGFRSGMRRMGGGRGFSSSVTAPPRPPSKPPKK